MKIRKMIYLPICLFLLLLNSCTRKEYYADAGMIFWDDFGKEIQLSGEVLPLENEILKPARILASDSILYLGNMHTPYLLQLIGLYKEKEKNLGEFVSFGSGPQELTYISKIQKKGNSLYLYDMNQLRLNEYVIGDSLLSFRKTTQFDYPFEDLFVISDSCVIALVINKDMKKLSFFQNGELINTYGEYPQIAGREMSSLELLEGFSSYIVADDECKRLAIVYKNTDLIEIYAEDGTLVKRVHGPNHFFPEVSTIRMDKFQKVASVSGKSRNGYFSPVPYGNYFLVLYSGRLYDREEIDYLMDWVLVFDWDGNPVKRYKLDMPVFFFSINSEMKAIYGISDSPEFSIIKYAL